MTEDLCAVDGQRPATLGLLCSEHGARIADHYGAREGHAAPGRTPSHGLPWMWDHLQLAYPSLAGWSGGTLAKGEIRDPEAEKLAAVITLRQEIHDHLTITARELAEDLGRTGPDLATTPRLRVQRSARWLLAHIEPLRAAQGARATSVHLANAIREATENYERAMAAGTPALAITDVGANAHAGAKAEAVRALLAEADALASRAHALAPWREAPTRIEGIPCRCGAVGTVHDFGDVRKCLRCLRSYSDIEWRALTRVLAHRFGQEGQTG